MTGATAAGPAPALVRSQSHAPASAPTPTALRPVAVAKEAGGGGGEGGITDDGRDGGGDGDLEGTPATEAVLRASATPPTGSPALSPTPALTSMPTCAPPVGGGQGRGGPDGGVGVASEPYLGRLLVSWCSKGESRDDLVYSLERSEW